METKVLAHNIAEMAKEAAGVLSHAGVILYPTDTLYGLGADAFSDAAVDKVYDIKGRDINKPIHAVFANVDMIEEYAQINDIGHALIEAFLPGPITIVFRKKPGIETGIARMIDTIGVRIPDNMFCVETAQAFGKPYTTTSANMAGFVTGRTTQEILEQFGEKKALIDLVVDAGELPQRKPSTVVDVSSGKLVILREGAISKSEILKAIAR